MYLAGSFVSPSGGHALRKAPMVGDRAVAAFTGLARGGRERHLRAVVEFLGINPNLARITKPHIMDEFDTPQPDSALGKRGSPTLTGSAVMVIRFEKSPGMLLIRRMEIVEECRIMGFDDCMWCEGMDGGTHTWC